MAPRAPPTPRTTRNSRGLRATQAGALGRLSEEVNPPPATPAPSGLSLVAALGRRSISPIFLAPPPSSLLGAQVTASPSPSPSTEAQVTAPPQITAPETPRGTVASLPAEPVEDASPICLAQSQWLRSLTWVRGPREGRILKATRERRGAKFARELLTADQNDRLMRGCACRPPIVFDDRKSAERGRGFVRFYLDDDKNLSVLYKKTDPVSPWCRCGKELLPIYGNLLNENGKRPAEDSELDLLAQNLGQNQATEFERVIPSPGDRGPRRPTIARLQTLKRRSMSYLAQLKIRLQNMGNSFLALLGSPQRQPAGRDHAIVDRRSVNPENKAVVAKRFKRNRLSLPANSEDPPVDLKDIDFLAWGENPRAYIGDDLLCSIRDQFAEQFILIQRGVVIYGETPAAIRAEIQPGQDLQLSLWINRLYLSEASETEGKVLHEPKKAKERYLAGLVAVLEFMDSVYSTEFFEEVCQLYPSPPVPFTLHDMVFRNLCQRAARFLNWMLQSAPLPTSHREAFSKMIMDGNAIHKQELPLSYVVAPGIEGRSAMPGSFTSFYDEFTADEITIDHNYDLKYPWAEAKSKPFQTAVGPPRSILKAKSISGGSGQRQESSEESASPRQQSASPHLESASAQQVPATEKRRKLTFGNTSFLPPVHIPFSVQQELELERRQAESEVSRTLSDGIRPEPNRIDMSVPTKTHELLGLPTPSNYTCAEIMGTVDPSERQLADERLNLRFHAAEYQELLQEFRTPSVKVWGPPAPPPLMPPTIRLLHVRDQKDADEMDWIIPGDKIEQNIEPEVPRLAASTTKKFATAQDRKESISKFFGLDGEDNAEASKSKSPLSEDLEIATAKLDEFNINRQIREEFTEGLAREVREKEQREIQRKAEEEEKRREEELRQQELERRRAEEQRLREEEEQRRVADARRRKEAAQYAQLTGLRPPARSMITPLTGEWNERVARASSHANPNTDLTTTLDGNPLRRPDFADRLLPPTAWLNDNVIIGSILYIAQYINDAAGVNSKQNPKCAALTSFFWPRLQQHGLNSCARLMRLAGIRKENFLDIDTILVPICQSSHWTLGVICPSRRTVSHIDSMKAGGSNPAISNRLMDWVKATLGDTFVESDWKQITYRAPLQTNGYDCGVFTITNAICLALGVDPNTAYSERELTLQRRRLAAILLNGGFKGEFTLAGL